MNTSASITPGLALLVLDVQDIFLRAISEGDALRASCHFAVQAARLLDIPVVFTEQTPAKLGPTNPPILAAAGESPTVFAKDSFSAFGCDAFSTWLAENDIRHLLICGLETPICVYQTALDALNTDISVTLLSDAIGARRSADHEAARRALEKKTDCHPLPAETVFYSVLRSARHPQFKTFTTLVKNRENPSATAK